MYTDNYIVKSLELHLFFARIMKEHALFLRLGFTPANASFSNRAEFYNKEFEKLLSRAVTIGDGLISQESVSSGEFVTEFTALAEKQTEALIGIAINSEITSRELRLNEGCPCNISLETGCQVRRLNQRALDLLSGLISFKERILGSVLNYEMFTMNYPLLIEHILREARLYRRYIEILEKEGYLSDESMYDMECFWNRIMMEHALFIRGLLDPSESELICTSNGFVEEYVKLLETRKRARNQTLTADSLEKTIKFRDFKATSTQGIEKCTIRSVILPLFADHVLREANHYIRLLTL